MIRLPTIMPLTPGTRLGAYEILGPLGSGGMGEVFRALDTRLDRHVAIKVLSAEMAGDAAAIGRFEREAKAVARLSHPNIVAIHDFANHEGTLYAVTELLEGQTLRDKLAGGPLTVDAALAIAIDIGEGLAAAHQRGVIHRDLKPENVFLTRENRVKILDFGLALTWPLAALGTEVTESFKTAPGMMMGTVGYMSPEQIKGEVVTTATDVFAFGCVLYEMLSGARPFARDSTMSTLAAVLSNDPPALPSRIPDSLRAIVRRCLEKGVAARYRAADDLLTDLKGVRTEPTGEATMAKSAAVAAPKRLIVLPFRLLRADAEFDFLSLSLPEAITTSLSAIESLIVRSSAIASRYPGETANLKTVAEETDVDWILTGSLLRGGQQLRVSAQLVDSRSGSVLWSHTFESAISGIFQLQDDLTRRIVDSLAAPLTEGERRSLRRDVPASALGYELFLRAMQQAHGEAEWRVARDLYLRSLDEDPNFAPAHARLGRIRWLLGKYTEDGDDNWSLAERSLQRALELNPDLMLAHRLTAELQTDLGRAVDALVGILDRLRLHPNSPELYIALVKVTRYCGLLDESLDAHRRARELDPKIPSSVAHTYVMRGEYETAMKLISRPGDIGYVEPMVLAMLGEREEAARRLRLNLARVSDVRLRAYMDSLRCALEGDRAGVQEAAERLRPIRDPEALYYAGRGAALAGDLESALSLLEAAIPGFAAVTAFERDPWLDTVRDHVRFQRLLDLARVRRDDAAQRYARHAAFI